MIKYKGFLSDVIVVGLCAVLLAACGSSADNRVPVRTPPPPAPLPTSTTFEVLVQNDLFAPIEGALVTMDVDGSHFEATTNAGGRAFFPELPLTDAVMAVAADGFEPQSQSMVLGSGFESWVVYLAAVDAWTVGVPFVLDTSVVQRAADGSSLTFSTDIAMIAGADPEPLLTLSAADFELERIDCGWGGSRDCASDSAGQTTGLNGIYEISGGASAFELIAAANGQPWLAGVLLERAGSGSGWDVLVPALKSYFAALGSEDAIGLASIQPENGIATLSVLGPFTADGGAYSDAIDGLAEPAEDYPQNFEGRLFDALLDAIRWTAAAAAENPDRKSTLLVEAKSWLSLAQLNEAVALARDGGVRISMLEPGDGELALRTGGFVSILAHINQYGMAFDVMDELLAGTMPFYRMQFTLTGAPDTFVPGGNARVYLRVNTPSPIVHRDVRMGFDVLIPE